MCGKSLHESSSRDASDVVDVPPRHYNDASGIGGASSGPGTERSGLKKGTVTDREV